MFQDAVKAWADEILSNSTNVYIRTMERHLVHMDFGCGQQPGDGLTTNILALDTFYEDNEKAWPLTIHPRIVMLEVSLNKFKSQAQDIVAEKRQPRDRFRVLRSTTKQIFKHNYLWKAAVTSAGLSSCLSRRQEDFWLAIICCIVGYSEEVKCQ